MIFDSPAVYGHGAFIGVAWCYCDDDASDDPGFEGDTSDASPPWNAFLRQLPTDAWDPLLHVFNYQGIVIRAAAIRATGYQGNQF